MKTNNDTDFNGLHAEEAGDSPIPPVDDGIQEATYKPAKIPTVYTLKELKALSLPEPDPIVQDLMFKKNISLVAAKPKVGKSTLLRYLAKSIVDGEQFLGRNVNPSNVLYLALEEPLYNVKRDFIAMEVANDSSLIISDTLNGDDKVRNIESLLKKFRPGIVFVDTMIHATGIKDTNDYSETTRTIARFRDLANRYDTHICLVHHSKKGEFQGNDSVLGSTGLTGAVDLIVTINAGPNGERAINSTGRSGIHFENMTLVFEPNSKTFRVGSERYENLEGDVLELISANPGIERDAIQKILKKKSATVTSILKSLKDEGRITAVKENSRNTYFIVDVENLGGEE